MKQETAHRQPHLMHSVIVMAILILTSIASVQAASDIIVTRPHSSSSSLTSNIYLGANVGSAMYDEINNSSAAYSLFGGYQINEVLAVEFAWTDLGEVSQDTNKADFSTLQVGLVGKIPVNIDFALFAEIGLARWDANLNTSTLSGADNDIDVFFGFGGDYLINSRSTVRFKADFYSMKPTISGVDQPEEKIAFLSIGYIVKL